VGALRVGTVVRAVRGLAAAADAFAGPRTFACVAVGVGENRLVRNRETMRPPVTVLIVVLVRLGDFAADVVVDGFVVAGDVLPAFLDFACRLVPVLSGM
jgi:hypothetical protein